MAVALLAPAAVLWATAASPAGCLDETEPVCLLHEARDVVLAGIPARDGEWRAVFLSRTEVGTNGVPCTGGTGTLLLSGPDITGTAEGDTGIGYSVVGSIDATGHAEGMFAVEGNAAGEFEGRFGDSRASGAFEDAEGCSGLWEAERTVGALDEEKSLFLGRIAGNLAVAGQVDDALATLWMMPVRSDRIGLIASVVRFAPDILEDPDVRRVVVAALDALAFDDTETLDAWRVAVDLAGRMGDTDLVAREVDAAEERVREWVDEGVLSPGRMRASGELVESLAGQGRLAEAEAILPVFEAGWVADRGTENSSRRVALARALAGAGFVDRATELLRPVGEEERSRLAAEILLFDLTYGDPTEVLQRQSLDAEGLARAALDLVEADRLAVAGRVADRLDGINTAASGYVRLAIARRHLAHGDLDAALGEVSRIMEVGVRATGEGEVALYAARHGRRDEAMRSIRNIERLAEAPVDPVEIAWAQIRAIAARIVLDGPDAGDIGREALLQRIDGIVPSAFDDAYDVLGADEERMYLTLAASGLRMAAGEVDPAVAEIEDFMGGGDPADVAFGVAWAAGRVYALVGPTAGGPGVERAAAVAAAATDPMERGWLLVLLAEQMLALP